MSTAAASLTTWEEFLVLSDAADGHHYELHDGEVILVPPPRARHVYIQSFLARWLTEAAKGHGWAAQEFPYRPAKNLQFWNADVAYLPNAHWEVMRGDEYSVYAPVLVIEVLSPSNKPEKVNRQRVAAFSAGTLEFWVVDPGKQTVEVSVPGSQTRVFGPGESVPVLALPGTLFPVEVLF